MRNHLAIILATAALSSGLLAEEVSVKSSIKSVALFKNGLAVIRREVKVPGPGIYLLEDVPEPIHGTWWIQSDAPVETQVTEREVSGPVRAALDLQLALVGKQVTIFFREGQIPPATGKVEAVASAKGEDAWNRSYQQPRYDYYYGMQNQPQPQNHFLILRTDKDRIFVDSNMIAYLKSEVKDEQDLVKRRVPVLLLIAGKEFQKPSTVTIEYLSKGLGWAPSYRVDVADPKTLSIEQSAVVKNELSDLEGTEMQLISGFPSVSFAHVTSPLSLRTNWTTFFQQINQRPGQGQGAITQQALSNNIVRQAEGIDLAAQPTGEGVDLSYQSIGALSLKEGDSMALSIARESAPYERIVEWNVPDTRNENGAYISDYERRQDQDKYENAAWDAVRFRNPFKFPMTTAPAMVVSGEHFNGQQMSYWVNAGEETSLRITKALSIRTRNIEHEEEGARNEVFVGGGRYVKTSVAAELSVSNHRKEDVTLVIRRRFSGELISADGEPKKSLLEEGVYSVNTRNELTWTLILKSGEEKTLKYRYSLLTPR